MTDITNLQPPISGANKKRKRASDAGRDGGSPKGPPMNGDHLDQTSAYGAEFVQHLQNATHGVSDSVGNGLGSDNPALPYGTNGEGHTGSFDMSDTNHQGTPYNYQAMYKHPEADVTPRSKPAVGSDEWHRNRKDCHKEGKAASADNFPCLLTLQSRTSSAGNYQRRNYVPSKHRSRLRKGQRRYPSTSRIIRNGTKNSHRSTSKRGRSNQGHT